jgi:hypothetical protein
LEARLAGVSRRAGVIAALLVLAATAPALQPQLQPLGFLIGHCWQGQVAPGRIDRHCFVALTDGAIRDRHVVVEGGKRVMGGESVYAGMRHAARSVSRIATALAVGLQALCSRAAICSASTAIM